MASNVARGLRVLVWAGLSVLVVIALAVAASHVPQLARALEVAWLPATLVVVVLALIPPIRALMRRCFLPAQGAGPSDRQRAQFWFVYQYTGTSDDGRVVRAAMRGGDPGYTETATILCDCALALVTQRHDLPTKRGGILTPGYALGMVLVRRLQASSTISLDIVDHFRAPTPVPKTKLR